MSDTDFFLNQTGGSVSTQLGPRLNNIKNQVLSTQSVIGIQPDNSTDAIPYTAFGKSLLNVSTLNGLVGLINSADTNVSVIDSGIGQIDFTLDNALKLSVKNAYTEVLNELRSLNINPLTDLEYSLGNSGKRWNNIYGNKIVDTIATRSGSSSIPFMQSTNVGTVSGQNVLWQHTTNESTPTNFQFLIETKDINTNFERMQISSYRNAYRNLHLQPSGKVLIGGDFSSVADSTLGTLNVRGGTTVLNVVGSSYPEILLKDTTNTADYISIMRDHSANKNIIRNSGRLDIECPANYQRMTFLSNGNVGVGTTAPTTLLDVSSSSINPTMTLATSNYTNNPVSATTVATFRMHNDKAQQDKFCDIKAVVRPSNHTPSIVFATKPSWDNAITDRMIITEAGNIGINQATPAERLDVVGNVKISSQLAIGTSVSANYVVDVRRTGVDAYARISGDVAQKQGLIFSDGATPTDIWTFYKQATTKTLNIYNNTTSSDLMTFTTGNLVGISNSSPTEKLDVVGNAKITGNILFDADNQRNVGSSGQALNSVFAHNGVFKAITVHSATAGNIGTLASPFNTAYLLNADIGNLVSNIKSMNITPTATNTYTIGSSSSTQYSAIYGNTIYGNGVVLTSDVNKKKDIQAIEDALSIIMRFESKSFKFKDGTSNRTHTGFIAQQIKEVIPDDWALYCDNKLGDIGLKYTEVIPLNTRAIQQLNERLSKVESRKLVGGAVIDTSGLTEDFVRVYERLEALESQLELVNKPVKPQLHRCVEVSRINEMMDRISNLECNESKSNSSEDFELMHSLMEKNHQQELRINELENKLNQIQSQPKVESKSVDFLAESDGGLNMIDMLQTKNYEMEQRILKLEKQNKKLVQAVNRLLKTTDE